MGYHEMEIGLKQVAAYVARWHETGRVPTIERDIVLERMQRIYAEIMQLRCTDGVAMQLAAARVEVEHVPATNGYDGMAPEDESFEVNGGGVDYGFAPMAESVAATEPAATAQFEERPAAEREDRISQTTHTVQEVGEQDPCPSQTRFLEEREVVLPFPEAAAAESAVEPERVEPVTITETEIEPEPESEPEQEIEPETEAPAKGGRSEESYLTQESGSREGYPQATEVPAMEPEVTAPTNTTATERAAEADEMPKSGRKPEKKKPETPRIFGIEVSPYARHEMIDTLFHGNEAMFESECEKLDTMGSLEEALVYIGEMYRWIPENAATIKFIDLLEARFGTEEGEA